MQIATRFSVVTVDERTETCRIAFDGGSLSETFAGAVLEGQFALDGHESLLILSDTDAYDAGLHMYLVDGSGEIIDTLEGGGVFQSGVFKLLATLPSALHFEFFTNSIIYQLTVATHAHLHFATAAGWRYPSKLKRHRLTLIELDQTHQEQE